MGVKAKIDTLGPEGLGHSFAVFGEFQKIRSAGEVNIARPIIVARKFASGIARDGIDTTLEHMRLRHVLRHKLHPAADITY